MIIRILRLLIESRGVIFAHHVQMLDISVGWQMLGLQQTYAIHAEPVNRNIREKYLILYIVIAITSLDKISIKRCL